MFTALADQARWYAYRSDRPLMQSHNLAGFTFEDVVPVRARHAHRSCQRPAHAGGDVYARSNRHAETRHWLLGLGTASRTGRMAVRYSFCYTRFGSKPIYSRSPTSHCADVRESLPILWRWSLISWRATCVVAGFVYGAYDIHMDQAFRAKSSAAVEAFRRHSCGFERTPTSKSRTCRSFRMALEC